MKFSVRQLLGFIAFASLAMGLSWFQAHESLGIILVAVVIPAYFLTSRSNWRRITYGGIAGVFVAFLIVESASTLRYAHLRHVPSSGYDNGRSAEEECFRTALDPFAVPFGFFLGATLFLATRPSR